MSFMSTPAYSVDPMHLRDAKMVGCKLTPSDAEQARMNGLDPTRSLEYGWMMGPAWTVWSRVRPQPIACVGYTREGLIWSMWTELNAKEAFHVARNTKDAVNFIRKEAAHNHNFNTLHNFMLVDDPAKRWLEFSGEFEFMPPSKLDGRSPKMWTKFQTKPWA